MAVDYYKDDGDNVKAGKALFYYGKVAALQDNDTLAIQAYLSALAKLEKTEEYKLQGLAYEYIGILNADSESYTKMLLIIIKVRYIVFRKAVDTLGVIYAYRDIARIYYVRTTI